MDGQWSKLITKREARLCRKPRAAEGKENQEIAAVLRVGAALRLRWRMRFSKPASARLKPNAPNQPEQHVLTLKKLFEERKSLQRHSFEDADDGRGGGDYRGQRSGQIPALDRTPAFHEETPVAALDP
jgi:hypothetical protein